VWLREAKIIRIYAVDIYPRKCIEYKVEGAKASNASKKKSVGADLRPRSIPGETRQLSTFDSIVKLLHWIGVGDAHNLFAHFKPFFWKGGNFERKKTISVTWQI